MGGPGTGVRPSPVHFYLPHVVLTGDSATSFVALVLVCSVQIRANANQRRELVLEFCSGRVSRAAQRITRDAKVDKLMFIVVVVVVCLGVALLRCGDLLALGQVRIRFAPVLLAALVLKAAVYSQLGAQLFGSGVWSRGIHLTVTVVLLAVLFANRDQPGFWLIGLGIFLNLIVISVNGGSMPVSMAGAARLGLPADPVAFHQQYGTANILMNEGARLGFLGDVIVWPAPLPAKVMSIGDLILAVGAFIFFQKVMVRAKAAPATGSAEAAGLPPGKG